MNNHIYYCLLFLTYAQNIETDTSYIGSIFFFLRLNFNLKKEKNLFGDARGKKTVTTGFIKF